MVSSLWYFEFLNSVMDTVMVWILVQRKDCVAVQMHAGVLYFETTLNQT